MSNYVEAKQECTCTIVRGRLIAAHSVCELHECNLDLLPLRKREPYEKWPAVERPEGTPETDTRLPPRAPDPFDYPHPAEAGEVVPRVRRPYQRKLQDFMHPEFVMIPLPRPHVITLKGRIVADCPTEDAARAALRLLSL